MSNFEIISCANAEEYLHILDLNNSRWLDHTQKSKWIFRGHTNTEHLLIPPLYRNKDGEYQYNTDFKKIDLEGVPELETTINNLITSRPKEENVDSARLAEIIKASLAEVDATDKFLLECNNKGLPIPSITLFNIQDPSISATQFLYNYLNAKIAHFMLNQRMAQRRILTGLFQLNKPICFALARHHGINNRLLDWTTNPRTAAFFSGYGAKTKAKMVCVWAINTDAYDYAHSRIHYHRRLHKDGLKFLLNQDGLFTELYGADSYFYKYGNWPSVVDYLVEIYSDPSSAPIDHKQYIKRIDLPINAVAELMRRLDTSGINNVSLRTTYDNVAAYVNARAK
jgi:hypothetical protein